MTTQKFAEKYKGCRAIWKVPLFDGNKDGVGTIIGYSAPSLYDKRHRVKFLVDGYPYEPNDHHNAQMDELEPIEQLQNKSEPLPLPG